MTKDMTTGNPVKLILAFSVPLLIGNIFQQFYNMVDAIIVGRYVGVEALAAIGATGSVTFLIYGFIMGLSGGFTILISQKFGANDEEGVKKAVSSAIFLSVIVTVVATVLSLITARPLLNIMNTPANIIEASLSYLKIIYIGLFATVLYNLLSGVLRALGDSKTPLYFLIIASLLNVVLDLIFVINFNMGVAGAAIATIISQFVAGVLCLIYITKRFPILRLKKNHLLNIDFSITKKQLKIGIPMALQFSITAIGTIILQTSLNGFGSNAVAAFTAASKVEQLVMQPLVSFGVTMATYCGQNLGARQFERIKEGVKKATIISISISILSGIIVMVFGGSFTRIFLDNPDAEVLNLSVTFLKTISVFFIPLGLIFIYRNTLQGIGESFIPMLAGVLELVARTLVAFTLPAMIGFKGICYAGPLAWIFAAVPLVITYLIKSRKFPVSKIETSKESIIA